MTLKLFDSPKTSAGKLVSRTRIFTELLKVAGSEAVELYGEAFLRMLLASVTGYPEPLLLSIRTISTLVVGAAIASQVMVLLLLSPIHELAGVVTVIFGTSVKLPVSI